MFEMARLTNELKMQQTEPKTHQKDKEQKKNRLNGSGRGLYGERQEETGQKMRQNGHGEGAVPLRPIVSNSSGAHL